LKRLPGLDVFDGLSRGLKSFAAKAVYGRLIRPETLPKPTPIPERQRPESGAEIPDDGGYRRQVAGNGLKFIAGGNGVGQLDKLVAQMAS